MPYTKEQLKEYWQTNKETLNQKRRERRRLAKLGLATNQVSHLEVSQVEPPKKVELLEVSHQQVEPVNPKTANLETANLNEVSYGKPANGKPSPEIANPEKVEPEKVKTIKLWSHHYSVKKPWCYSCQQKGIPENQYTFCSPEKVKDALSIRLPNRYVCNVYHWTLYQGQGKLGGKV